MIGSVDAWPTLLPSDSPLPPATGERLVVFLDAGHGAEGNLGNTSSRCVAEQDFTQALADDVAAVLEESGWFWVQTSRVGDERVPYAARVAAAGDIGAHVLVSLHSDIRGRTEAWQPSAECRALKSEVAPGFSVLYSDEGEAPSLREARRAFASSVADSMAEAGFLPFRGDEYAGLYDPLAGSAGAFVDRHEPDKRIYLLRRPEMPSILVETHNALDPREVDRWDDDVVRRAFALALGRGLLAAVGRLPMVGR